MKQNNTPAVENIRSPWIRRPVVAIVLMMIVMVFPLAMVVDLFRKVIFGPANLFELVCQYGDNFADAFRQVKTTWKYNYQQRRSVEKAMIGRQEAKSKLNRMASQVAERK